MVNVSKTSIFTCTVFKIYKKYWKQKYPQILMGVVVRKSLILEIAKKNNKTFTASKHNFKRHFGITWYNDIKIVFNCRFICCYDARKRHNMKCFCDSLKIKRSHFLFLYILAMHYSLRHCSISFSPPIGFVQKSCFTDF